jgi:hypothetical protein
MFTLYNKKYSNVNNKQLQLTTVHFLTLNGLLRYFSQRATRETPKTILFDTSFIKIV